MWIYYTAGAVIVASAFGTGWNVGSNHTAKYEFETYTKVDEEANAHVVAQAKSCYQQLKDAGIEFQPLDF